MASISVPTPTKLTFPTSQNFLRVKRSFYPQPLSQFPDFTLCRSSSPSSSDNSSSPNRRWHSAIEDVVKDVAKRFDSFINLYKEEVEKKRTMNEDDNDRIGGVFIRENGVEEWDWERWKKHFEQVDEQERLVSVLKSQLDSAIYREDYEDAARLKVAIAASATNDTVGRVVSNLNRAVVDERYQDAAYLRDKAGAGLVGWWAGMSEDKNDPYGLIICVTAEHGKYVARSYSPRQLATASPGVPLFEIFLTVDKKGEYKLQAVYLKQRDAFDDSLTVSPKILGASSRLNPSGSTGGKADLLVVSTEDEDGDDRDDASDPAEGLSDFRNVLPDMIPGVRVKVLKVTAPGKVDRDFISKLIEQIIEEDEEEKDTEAEDVGEGEDEEGDVDSEDEENDGSNQERNGIGMEDGNGIIENEDRNEITLKVIGGLVQKLSGGVPAKEFLRVPAKLDKKGLLSFSFSIEQDNKQQDSGFKELSSTDKRDKLRGQLSLDNVMYDLTKFIGKEKIPLKVLEDIGELINLSLSRAQKRQQLSGSTTFHRIETVASSDPLNGLYIGAHGLYTSEVIHLRHRFGQWQDSSGARNPQNLEFYEYVEAIKVTGDPYVPAGQVAFRAKVGKRFQLPHKGIIPEEFGVIARYKGQGRLAEPGFRNPRWVDGELVILDGKYIKGGPVVGFVYWAPEYHFLVFFNRLRLQQ